MVKKILLFIVSIFILTASLSVFVFLLMIFLIGKAVKG
ncbi:putative membrane protein [Streptococcus sanguinis]|nr:putative membrane protein [Streptococcus sanguinis]